MSDTPNALLRQYVKLTEFLGAALGPDYEVALHDLTDKNQSIIAIANGYISGREVGAPLTNMALSVLKDESYEWQDYRLHYSGLSAAGNALRSSTMFIKEDGKLIGMLCINFDDSRFQSFAQQVLTLCHPNQFVQAQDQPPEGADLPRPETFRNSTDAVTQDELGRLGVPADRLTSEERLQVISALEASGIFLLKGAVKDVAASLGCSQASVYRYLSQIRK